MGQNAFSKSGTPIGHAGRSYSQFFRALISSRSFRWMVRPHPLALSRDLPLRSDYEKIIVGCGCLDPSVSLFLTVGASARERKALRVRRIHGSTRKFGLVRFQERTFAQSHQSGSRRIRIRKILPIRTEAEATPKRNSHRNYRPRDFCRSIRTPPMRARLSWRCMTVSPRSTPATISG